VMQSWIFFIVISIFSVTWSFRNQFKMLLKKHLLLLLLSSMLKTVVLL